MFILGEWWFVFDLYISLKDWQKKFGLINMSFTFSRIKNKSTGFALYSKFNV